MTVSASADLEFSVEGETFRLTGEGQRLRLTVPNLRALRTLMRGAGGRQASAHSLLRLDRGLKQLELVIDLIIGERRVVSLGARQGFTDALLTRIRGDLK